MAEKGHERLETIYSCKKYKKKTDKSAIDHTKYKLHSCS